MSMYDFYVIWKHLLIKNVRHFAIFDLSILLSVLIYVYVCGFAPLISPLLHQSPTAEEQLPQF